MKNYDSAPNSINQDDVGFIFQDLKLTSPRVWQAITSLKSHPLPMPFVAEIVLPGTQTVGQDVLDHPCILKLPIDPYGVWEVSSVILQDLLIACKAKPSSSDYIVDILITRNNRETFTSIFHSDSIMAKIKANGDFQYLITGKELGTIELRDNDGFRVDIVQADSTVKDCWIILRGYANLKKLKRKQ